MSNITVEQCLKFKLEAEAVAEVLSESKAMTGKLPPKDEIFLQFSQEVIAFNLFYETFKAIHEGDSDYNPMCESCMVELFEKIKRLNAESATN